MLSMSTGSTAACCEHALQLCPPMRCWARMRLTGSTPSGRTSWTTTSRILRIWKRNTDQVGEHPSTPRAEAELGVSEMRLINSGPHSPNRVIVRSQLDLL